MAKIMAVLNMTPDSFSNSVGQVSVNTMISDGADIIDVGAESTGPGSKPISEAEEIKRLDTVIEDFSKRIPFSIDTYKSKVAEHALSQGASIVNDVSALRADPEMVNVVASSDCKVVLMHSKERELPHATEATANYEDVVGEITDWLLDRVSFAEKNGVKKHNIILDPGAGMFISTNPLDSWELIKNFKRLVKNLSPYPVLIGVSRKSFLGGALSERDNVSALAAAHCISAGATYVRTHNPKLTMEFL